MHLGFFIDVAQMPVLVIGGGKVARRKSKKLIKAGALVTAVAPEFNSTFPSDAEMIVDTVTPINFIDYMRTIKPQLIILATSDHTLHQLLIPIAKEQRIFVNDSQDGYTQFAFANTTSTGKSLISYFSHGDMHATRRLKRNVSAFVKELNHNEK